MRQCKIILALLLSCVGAYASSVIVGQIIDQSGSPKIGQITLQPLSTPAIVGTQYVSGSSIQITLTNGGFTNSLLQGDYLMIIGNQESPRISVPSSGTNNFIDLINTNGLIYAFKSPGSVVKLDQYDSTFGFMLDKLVAGTPIVSTTNNYGANESVTLTIPRATNSVSGYLHLSDWSTFNAKVDTADGVNALLATNHLTSGYTNQYKLGAKVTGASVTLNTTNYLQFVIDGVTNKVALVQ